MYKNYYLSEIFSKNEYDDIREFCLRENVNEEHLRYQIVMPYTKPSDGSKEAIARAKCRNPLVSRETLCTDISIDTCTPEKAFIKAWYRLVKERKKYLIEWLKTTVRKMSSKLTG